MEWKCDKGSRKAKELYQTAKDKEIKAAVHAYCEEHKMNKVPDEFRLTKAGNIEMGLLGCDDKMYWFPKATLPLVLEKIVDKFMKLGG